MSLTRPDLFQDVEEAIKPPNQLRCLTLTQPWATLVAIGAKRIETRSWPTHYRGPIGIHAAKGLPAWAYQQISTEPFRSVLMDRGVDVESLCAVRGKLIAVCDIVDVQRITKFNRPAGAELAFGDYRDGRHMWILDNVRLLSVPIEVKGALSLWKYEISEPGFLGLKN